MEILGKLCSGARHYKWKGGTSRAFLRKACLTRDDYTCQHCGLREPDIMEVDHIKPKADYPELAKDITNLITLCPNCHRRKTNKELREKGLNARQQYFSKERILSQQSAVERICKGILI